MLVKCILSILELNWYQKFGFKKRKLKICHYALVIHVTAKLVISRRGMDEKSSEM